MQRGDDTPTAAAAAADVDDGMQWWLPGCLPPCRPLALVTGLVVVSMWMRLPRESKPSTCGGCGGGDKARWG